MIRQLLERRRRRKMADSFRGLADPGSLRSRDAKKEFAWGFTQQLNKAKARGASDTTRQQRRAASRTIGKHAAKYADKRPRPSWWRRLVDRIRQAVRR